MHFFGSIENIVPGPANVIHWEYPQKIEKISRYRLQTCIKSLQYAVNSTAYQRPSARSGYILLISCKMSDCRIDKIESLSFHRHNEGDSECQRHQNNYKNSRLGIFEKIAKRS